MSQIGDRFQESGRIYYFDSGNFTVLAAAHAATAGFCWLINPLASGLQLIVHELGFTSQLGSALVAAVSTVLSIERVTFTGTASGATVNMAQRLSSDAAPTGSLRTASTGLTLAAVARVVSFDAIGAATAVGYVDPVFDEWAPRNTGHAIVLLAGEGLVMRQANAGVTSDTRTVSLSGIFEERAA